MTEDDILKAWRASIKPGDKVRHRSDWVVGTVIGRSTHPMYDLVVDFMDSFGTSEVYARNIYPEWWPILERDHLSYKR